MSFASMIKADLDVIVAGEFGETIRYKPCGGSWASISALVESENIGSSNDFEIGIKVHGRKGPIYVTVSKTDVESVRKDLDIVEWNGDAYYVRQVDTEDASGWRIYCVR